MIIQTKFPHLPSKSFEGDRVWRCVASDPDAKVIGELGGSTAEEEAIIYERIVKLTIRRSASRSRLKWGPPARETRYSKGDVAIVYTACEPETAVVERFHWAFRDLDHSNLPTAYTVCLELLEIEFTGQVRSIVDEVPPCMAVVHPSDYTCCQEVGRMASNPTLDLDALVVPSARKLGGVNVPIFLGRNVGDVKKVDGIAVRVDGDDFSATVNGMDLDPRSEEVFDMIA